MLRNWSDISSKNWKKASKQTFKTLTKNSTEKLNCPASEGDTQCKKRYKFEEVQLADHRRGLSFFVLCNETSNKWLSFCCSNLAKHTRKASRTQSILFLRFQWLCSLSLFLTIVEPRSQPDVLRVMWFK